MISIVRTLGAPVMEPPGNAARRQATAEAPGARSPRTVLTIWCTAGGWAGGGWVA